MNKILFESVSLLIRDQRDKMKRKKALQKGPLLYLFVTSCQFDSGEGRSKFFCCCCNLVFLFFYLFDSVRACWGRCGQLCGQILFSLTLSHTYTHKHARTDTHTQTRTHDDWRPSCFEEVTCLSTPFSGKVDNPTGKALWQGGVSPVGFAKVDQEQKFLLVFR